MADAADIQGAINWRQVLTKLLRGKTVELPVEDEAEMERRATQAAQRAEKQGLPLTITRGDGVLQLSLEREAARQFREQRKARRQARRSGQQPA